MLALVAVGLSACDGKDIPGYDSASKPSDDQRVFFASASQSENVDADQSSFDVMLYRPEDADSSELTVQLLSSCTVDGIIGTIIKVPETATFAAGSPNTVITVDCDAAALTANTPYSISITVDEAHANLYGVSSITLSITRPDFTDWAPFGLDEDLGRTGLGSYTFTQYYSGTEDPVQVLERHVPTDPNDMEFQFQWLIDNDNPDLGYETFMTAYTKDGGKTIYVPEQYFTYNSNYGEVYVADMYTFTGSTSYGASTFDDITGQFTLNVIYYLADGRYFGYGDEYLNLVGYIDTNDYTISLTNKGQIDLGGDYLVVEYSATSAVNFSYYTVVKSLFSEDEYGDKVLDEDAYAEVVNGIAAQVLDPENASTSYDLYRVDGESKNLTLTFSSPGDYTMVAVAFHTDNAGVTEAKSDTYLDFYFDTFNPWDGWTTVSEDATYYDNFIACMYGASSFANYPITVTVQKSDDYDGLYRIVNPYTEFADYGLDIADFGSIEFDASDPDHVYFPMSDTGIIDGGDAMYLLSYSYYYMSYGYTVDDIPSAYWGTFKDNTVTMSALNAGSGYSNFLVQIGSSLYYCDIDFDLDLGSVASKPSKSTTTLKNAILRNLAPVKGKLKPMSTYFKVKNVEDAPKAKASRTVTASSPKHYMHK